MAEVGGDWRCEERYAPLLNADRSAFAWEWLRRSPQYTAEAKAAQQDPSCRSRGAAAWGLHAYEDPSLSAPQARPFWAAEAHPSVLRVAAVPAAPGPDSFDPSDFPGLVERLETNAGAEALRISDGFQVIRIDVVAGRLGDGAAQLCYLPFGIRSAERTLLTLRRFLHLCRAGAFSGPLFRPDARVRRWILELRTHDALRTGATQREIAAELFDPIAAEPRWRIEAPTVRLQAQRLVARARTMAAGGYRTLL